MTNDIRLEIEDTETGVELTATPSDEGVQLTLEDDNSAITLDLDYDHAYSLVQVLQHFLATKSENF